MDATDRAVGAVAFDAAATPTGPKAPVYKRPWFIIAAVIFGLIVLGGIAGGSGSPESTTPIADTDDEGGAESRTAAAPEAVSVAIPDVVGLDEREATTALEGAGLDVSLRREDVDGADRGEVVGQKPAAGTDVDEGTTVVLRVATGVVSVAVPDVTGMKLAAGSDVLSSKGFKVDVTKIEDDSVPEGQILEQSATGQADEGATITLTVAKAPKPQLTSGQENALRSADSYISMSGFSRKGLIEQLEFEGYTTKDATFAVDHLDVNWSEQAARSAKSYLDMSPFSRQGLIEQLEFEGYTAEQAAYGADKAL